MIVVHIDRNCFAIFGCLWAEPRRTMVLLFHDRLLRCNTCAYTQTYQKEQQLFNPRRALGAPWVGSAHRDSQPPLRDTLYLNPMQQIVYENYMKVRTNIDVLKGWIDARVED